MSRLHFLLLGALVMCALSVINATDQQRRIFIELDRAQTQERQLRQEWSQLQYQQGALSKISRIESVAQRVLKMRPVSSGLTHYLTDQAPQAPVFSEKGGG
ncbi:MULTISPECIES: cell division protein FtsL [unclassified Mycoavidus]|uniref:cell division protein FtsL n=1 Tax=unclassified Mycoavidus TaxID=2649241 RepID=UPI001CBC9922|nr:MULTISPECIES: cell division protein FtsL [unclassified Mycoavidus]UAW63935.1 cell division protein FtsL [Mycoavidus sp. HKI]UUM21364.1 cell division protein FtsL [Mycoavidus sp. SF9855]